MPRARDRARAHGPAPLPPLEGRALAADDRERWDRKWGEGGHPVGEAPAWLAELRGEWPAGGRALDVAAGAGRVALFLAEAGYAVTAVDVSPVGLERARREAARRGLPLETRVLDLESEPLPPGPWAWIACFHYLQRDLVPAMLERLAPGGLLALELPTRRNLERHAHPSARFTVEPGELARWIAPLEPLYLAEGWLSGQHLARALARLTPRVGASPRVERRSR